MTGTDSSSSELKAVTVYLDRDMQRKFRKASVDVDRSMSSILGDLVARWLDAYNKGETLTLQPEESDDAVELTTAQITQLRQTQELLHKTLSTLDEHED